MSRVLHGLRHVLTPGSAPYAVLKLSAVAAVFGLQYAARRGGRRRHG